MWWDAVPFKNVFISSELLPVFHEYPETLYRNVLKPMECPPLSVLWKDVAQVA